MPLEIVPAVEERVIDVSEFTDEMLYQVEMFNGFVEPNPICAGLRIALPIGLHTVLVPLTLVPEAEAWPALYAVVPATLNQP